LANWNWIFAIEILVWPTGIGFYHRNLSIVKQDKACLKKGDSFTADLQPILCGEESFSMKTAVKVQT
jgi:hypothetical protein